MYFSSSFLNTPQSPRETIIPSQPVGAISYRNSITDPNANLDLRVATCDLQKSYEFGYSDKVPDGDYFFTSDSLEEILNQLGQNPNKPRSQEKRDVGLLESRDLRYMPLTHRGRATLRRLPLYNGTYIYDFPCFPVNTQYEKGTIGKLCKRWFDSGTILALIRKPGHRELFLAILYTQRKMPIMRSSKNKIRTTSYKMTSKDKDSSKALRKYSPSFWSFLHEPQRIEAHGLGEDIAYFVTGAAMAGTSLYFGLSQPVPAILFISSLGGMLSSGFGIATDPLVRTLTNKAVIKTYTAVTQLRNWVQGLWVQFDNALTTGFGSAWTAVPDVIRKIIAAVCSCGIVSGAIAASYALYKMVSDVLHFTVAEDDNKVEAHAPSSTIEVGAIAAILASFLITTDTTDSNKTFALFNTMYRSLSVGFEMVDDVIPYKEWINKICESCDCPGPFTILRYREEINIIEGKVSQVLNAPDYHKRVRTDPGLAQTLAAYKKELRNLTDVLRFNRNVSTDVKSQLIRTFNKVCDAHTQCVRLNERYCKRPLPVWIDGRGDPGQGKTEVTNIAAKLIFKRLYGREMDNTDCFSKTPGSPYWAGYDSDTTWCIFMDEFLTSTLVAVNQPESSCMLNMIGTQYCPFDMPDVESKGVTACRAAMVVTTGNGDFSVTGLANPDALRRRIAFPIKVVRKKTLPNNPTRKDFDNAWMIMLNDDYYKNTKAYKGIWPELKPTTIYTLTEFVDMATRAIMAADTATSLYDQFVQAHARVDISTIASFDDDLSDIEDEEDSDSDNALLRVIKPGKTCFIGQGEDENTYLCFYDRTGDKQFYRTSKTRLHPVSPKSKGFLCEITYFDDIWEALCHLTKHEPCYNTISAGHDDGTICFDKVHKKTLTLDFCPLGRNGFIDDIDLYNLPREAVRHGIGSRIPYGDGLECIEAVYERMCKPGVYVTPDPTQPGRFDVGTHKFDLLNTKVNHTPYSFIPRNVRTNMHKYALPIALGVGTFVGAAALITAVVKTYAGVEKVETQSVQKHDVKDAKVTKPKEAVLPKYKAPTIIKAHGALDDSVSLCKNITGILSEGTGMRCWGIFIDSSTMITVGHVMRRKGNLRIFDTTQITYQTLAADDYSTDRVANSDLCFIFFRRPRIGIKSIISRFCDTDIPTNATVRRMNIMTSGKLSCAYSTACNTTVSVGVSYLCKNGQKIYPIDSFVNVDDPTGKVGDCGLPYLRLENGSLRITGMHFGGTGKTSCMQPMSRDMLKFYMAMNPYKELSVIESVIDVHCDFASLCDTKDGVISIAKLNCKPAFYPRGNTRLSSLASIDIEDKPFPAYVKDNAPATCHGPIAESASDFSKRGQYKSTEIMDAILTSNILRESYNYREILKHPWPHPNSYSYKDIVLGVPGVMHGLSDSTSLGPLFKRGMYGIKPITKKDLWCVEDRYMNPEFEALIFDRIEKAERGIITPMVVEGQYKDEVRDKAAKTVVVDGIVGIKPREFYVACPLDIIETKTLLWPMLKVLHDSPVVSQCGINAWSIEWTMLIKDVKTRPNAMYVDVKSFDKTVDTYAFRNMLEECILEMYAQYDDEKLNNRIKVLMTKIFDYLYIQKDQLYEIIGPNPSGNILTVFDNCSRTWFYLKVCFIYLRTRYEASEDLTFEDNVTLKSNGDDCFVGVSAEAAPFFNAVTYAQVMYHIFGAIVTDLDKVPFKDKENAAPFQPFETADFLSRGFSPIEGGKYLAPLKLSSIWNSVYWTKTEPEDKYERVSHYEQIIDGCLRELALHSKIEFDEFVDVIKPRFIRIGGTWLSEWKYEPYRAYMEHYASCSDITKVPTPYGCIQAHCSDENGPEYVAPVEIPIVAAQVRAPPPQMPAPRPIPFTYSPYFLGLIIFVALAFDSIHSNCSLFMVILAVFRFVPLLDQIVKDLNRIVLRLKKHSFVVAFIISYGISMYFLGGYNLMNVGAYFYRDALYGIAMYLMSM